MGNIKNFDNSKKKNNKSKWTQKESESLSNKIEKYMISTPTPSGSITGSDFKYTFKVDEFGMRGLNKYKNILQSPECDCGCGGKAMPVFEDKDDLYEFCGYVLENEDCDNCAIFLVHKDGMQEITHKHWVYDEDNEEEDLVISLISPKKSNAEIDFFSKMDALLGLHCYGLMIEHENGAWEICE